MLKHQSLYLLLPVALLLAACSKSADDAETPQTDAAAPETSEASGSGGEGSVTADPTVVDPDHYQVEFENDAVRVLRINYGAGEESVMHSHPGGVAVYLNDIEAQFEMPDGTIQDASGSAGSVFIDSGGAHLPKNIGDSAFEVIEVELKAREASDNEAGGPDPIDVDADHYSIEGENDAVRVLRIHYGAGETSVMHYHPDAVAIFLTDHLVEMEMPGGTSGEISASAGDVLYVPAGQHLPTNIGDAPVEVVLVELK